MSISGTNEGTCKLTTGSTRRTFRYVFKEFTCKETGEVFSRLVLQPYLVTFDLTPGKNQAKFQCGPTV